jgi:hypothetical protein
MRVSMEDIVRISLYFPRFVEEDENRYLMEEIRKKSSRRYCTTFRRIRALVWMDG